MNGKKALSEFHIVTTHCWNSLKCYIFKGMYKNPFSGWQSIHLPVQTKHKGNDWFIYFAVSYAPFQYKLPCHGCSSASTIPTESLWAPVCGILSKGNLTVRIYHQVLQQVAQLITKAVWTALSGDTALNHLNLRENSGELLQRLIQWLHWGLWMKHDGHEGI